MNENSESKNSEVSELFGLYKAEWLSEKLFELFTAPAYFNELNTRRPCVLIGGRGTGKTTVLKGLSYQGQFALSGFDKKAIPQWNSYGLYTRVNTNRVTAFKGSELNEKQWIRCFSHYINLLLCELVVEFVEWFEIQNEISLDISKEDFDRISISLNLNRCENLKELSNNLKIARVKFEASINNVGDGIPSGLSAQGAPLDELTAVLMTLKEFRGKQLFFIIDEYENFEDYQQQVVNSYIKHTQENYTFKIGVRELGWRQRATLRQEEQLRHPADYVRIDINEAFTQDRFNKFAKDVCLSRLKAIKTDKPIEDDFLDYLFPTLSYSEEVEKLVDNKNYFDSVREKYMEISEDKSFIEGLSSAELYFLDRGTLVENIEPNQHIKYILENKSKWADQFNNHIHSTLFGVRKGKRGIRKYYSGWSVLTRLSGRNIRYLLELVHFSFVSHFEEKLTTSTPISALIQTKAAQEVGRKNLAELEGISVDGARLTKLLLGLGRIFEVMAENPEGHAPEVNQFYINWQSRIDNEKEKQTTVEKILKSAVMHQALIRLDGSKLLDDSDIRDYDYMIHPIFCALFAISHRKKRKFKIKFPQIIKLVENPKETINEILSTNNRPLTEALPDQLALFKDYYGENL
jgi:hypothetical protein